MWVKHIIGERNVAENFNKPKSLPQFTFMRRLSCFTLVQKLKLRWLHHREDIRLLLLLLLIELLQETIVIENVLIRTQCEIINELDYANDRTAKAKRENSAVITEDIVPCIQNCCFE